MMLRRLRSLGAKILGRNDPRSTFGRVSYSQTGEDLIIAHIFRMLGVETPSYLDIGANHPYRFNNTAALYLNGSRGVNVEPDPDLFHLLAAERPEDVNLNVGIGDREGVLPFYLLSESTLNTFSKPDAENSEKEGYRITGTRDIPVRTLENVLREHLRGRFPEFLSLDTEGFDEKILHGMDFDGPPLVICAETSAFSAKRPGEKKTDLIDFLVSKGYQPYADTHINTIFVLRTAWKT